MNYMITGATGFVGGHVARQLLENGHTVVALVRNPGAARDLDDAGVKIVDGDITRKSTLRGPMRGFDGVFHIAGWYEIGADEPTVGEQINVNGTRNVLEVMIDLEIPKGVYTSKLAVNSDTNEDIVDESYRYEGSHLTVYDRTKWQAHYKVVEPMVCGGVSSRDGTAGLCLRTLRYECVCPCSSKLHSR